MKNYHVDMVRNTLWGAKTNGIILEGLLKYYRDSGKMKTVNVKNYLKRLLDYTMGNTYCVSVDSFSINSV